MRPIVNPDSQSTFSEDVRTTAALFAEVDVALWPDLTAEA
jgi:hypothetical protein